MAKVLIDSCVWVSYFRDSDPTLSNIVDNLVSDDAIVLCGIVEMEIFAGVRPKEKNKIRSLFTALEYIESTREVFQQAGQIYNNLRLKGITIPATDCIVAATAIHNNLEVLTIDKHFTSIQLRTLKITR